MKQEGHFYLAAATVCSPAAAERVSRQGHMLDDLREVEIYLQQQVLAPLTHCTEEKKNQIEICPLHLEDK